MKHNIELLKAEIHAELEKLRQLEGEFDAALERVDLNSPDPIPNYDRAAIGYLLHGFYNGCENMFRAIGRFFENDLGTESWHRDLLRRMQLEIHGYRPAVIDAELSRLLDDFRAFRHRFRHSYSFELDWDRERLVAGRLKRTAAMVRLQVQRFIQQLETVDL